MIEKLSDLVTKWKTTTAGELARRLSEVPQNTPVFLFSEGTFNPIEGLLRCGDGVFIGSNDDLEIAEMEARRE